MASTRSLCACALAFLVLAAVVSVAAAGASPPAVRPSLRSPLDACSIANDWNATVPGRSARDLFAVVLAPYCQFVSSAYTQPPGGGNGEYQIYALDVRTGRTAWHWNCSDAPCDAGLDYEGAVVPSHTTTGRLYISVSTDPTPIRGQHCDVLHALDAASGKTLYTDAVCFDQQGQPLFPAVLVFPLSALPVGQELVLHLASPPVASQDSILHVVNGSTGQLLWSGNLTSVMWSGRFLPLNEGVEGLFSLASGSGAESVYRVHPDGSVTLEAAASAPLDVKNLQSLRLAAQPSLLHSVDQRGSSVSAVDVITGAVVWNSSDAFLVGDQWGANDSFAHFSTDFGSLSNTPQLFLVVNTASSKSGPTVVLTQLALYNTSTGRQYSLSPLFTLTHLTHAAANPTAWDFAEDGVLAVRADSQWFMLDLPQLTLRASGHYASADQGFTANEWLVNVDGSYIAVPYGTTSAVQGFAPRVDYSALTSTAAAPVLTSAPPLPPTRGVPSSTAETAPPLQPSSGAARSSLLPLLAALVPLLLVSCMAVAAYLACRRRSTKAGEESLLTFLTTGGEGVEGGEVDRSHEAFRARPLGSESCGR